jgi:hypothetical protein
MIENLSAYFLARFRDLPQLGRRRTIDATGIRVVASRDTLKGSNQFFFKIEFVSFVSDRLSFFHWSLSRQVPLIYVCSDKCENSPCSVLKEEIFET